MKRVDLLIFLKRLFALGWLILLASALGLGLSSAIEIRATLLLALGMLAYLSVWGLAFGLRAEDPQPLLIRCGLCTFSLALAVGFVEFPGVIGVVDYRSIFATPAPAWNRPGNVPDPDLLYVREGRQTLRWRFQGNDLHRLKGMSGSKVYANELKLDRNGFRNREENERAEIVLIGDSFIEAPHTLDGSLISTRLADLTGKRVANLGRSGYGPIQELIVLERFGLPLNPKEVVWAIYEGNDLADIREYPAARDRLIHQKPLNLAARLVDRSFTNNSVEFLIRRWLRPEATRDPSLYRGHFETRGGEDVAMYFSSDDYNPASGPRADSNEFRKLGEILERAAELCRAHSARLTVAFIPTKWRIYRGHCGFEPGARCLAWKLDELPSEVGKLSGSIPGGVNFVDLTERLEDAVGEGAVVYLPDDTHWSDEGHAIAAKTLAESLSGKASETER